MYNSRILPVAQFQINEALSWYKKINDNLKKEFKLELIQTISILEKSPEHFQIRYNDIRLKKIGKFPYSIHYKIYNNLNTIVISAIFHEKEDSKKWDVFF